MSAKRSRHRKDPIPIADRLSRYRGGAGAPPGGETGRLQAAWPSVVGKQAARQSVVVRRSRAGVVSVACASAIWAQELDARRDLLAAQLARAVPDVEITGVRFVVGDHVIPQDAVPASRPVPAPSAAERAAAQEAMKDVSDPALRALLERAAAGQQALARRSEKPLRTTNKTPRTPKG